MSNTPNVEVPACPEPTPYSYSSDMAPVDFASTLPVVFSAQPAFAPVDSILANQLGPITNPVTDKTFIVPVGGAPILPIVDYGIAEPQLSSTAGSSINESTTLFQNNLVDFKSVNDIVPPEVQQPPVVQPPFVQPPVVQPPFVQPPVVQPPEVQPPFVQPPEVQPQDISNMIAPPTESAPIRPEQFKNINKYVPKIQKNLASFIQSFGSKSTKEHFTGSVKGILDIILGIVLAIALAFYVHEHWHPTTAPEGFVSSAKKTFQSLWPWEQLHNPDVSDNNKLMIVLAIVITVIILYRIL